jgi:hypothetical protein
MESVFARMTVYAAEGQLALLRLEQADLAQNVECSATTTAAKVAAYRRLAVVAHRSRRLEYELHLLIAENRLFAPSTECDPK